MNKLIIYFLVIVFVYSCSKNSGTSINSNTLKNNSKSIEAKDKNTVTMLKTAKKYLGTPYKYGGIDTKGIDCSGLVFNAFNAIGVTLPRMSIEQANKGRDVSITNILPGDVLFFNTSGNKISHAGIVESIKNGEIFFIHSSTSKGVIISSLKNDYWKTKFVKAVRMM